MSPDLVPKTMSVRPSSTGLSMGDIGMSQSGPTTFGQLSVKPAPAQPTMKESSLYICCDHSTFPVCVSSARIASLVDGAGYVEASPVPT